MINGNNLQGVMTYKLKKASRNVINCHVGKTFED
jgi:hypothetical protein